MSEFKLKFQHVSSVPFAEITPKGIKYGKHEFEGKVSVKNPDTGKMEEKTVVRMAEREWMLGTNDKYFIMKDHALVFDLDPKKLKEKADALFDFITRGK